MTFTVKIALQPFEVAFEAGSIAEAVAILEDPQNELSKLAALANGSSEEAETGTAAEVTEQPDKPKRGRKPKAAPEAVAPAPIPVGDQKPPAAPAPDTTPNAGGIPAFLDRSAPAAVAPPPPAPVAPPPAPMPPVGKLSGPVIAELNKRKEGSADNGAALVAWLSGAALVVPGATYDEAIECLALLDDAKLGPVANALGVAA